MEHKAIGNPESRYFGKVCVEI